MVSFNFFRRRIPGPDYSDITTVEAAREAARTGKLRAVFQTPVMCGGQETPENVLYVPAAAAELKERADDSVVAAAQRGTVCGYECLPAYEGTSIVPVSLRIIGTDAEGDSQVSHELTLWGKDYHPA